MPMSLQMDWTSSEMHKRSFYKKDILLLLQKVSKHQFVHKIAEYVGWKMLWGHALDHGPSVMKGMKNLVRVITYSDLSLRKCPLYDTVDLDKPTLAMLYRRV